MNDELTFEQFEKDCELVLAVYGHEDCSKFWAYTFLSRVSTYQEVCRYSAGALFALDKKSVIFERACQLYKRDRTSQPHTV